LFVSCNFFEIVVKFRLTETMVISGRVSERVTRVRNLKKNFFFNHCVGAESEHPLRSPMTLVQFPHRAYRLLQSPFPT